MDLKYTIESSDKGRSRLVFHYSSKKDSRDRLEGEVDARYVCHLGKRRNTAMGYLLLVKNGAPQLKFALGEATCLGRSSECEVQLLDTQLSRKHTKITRREDEYWIEDMESKNGTFVGDHRIAKPYKLVSGDEIRIGGLSLIFDPIVDILEQQDCGKSVYLVSEGEGDQAEVEPLSSPETPLSSDAIHAIHRITCDIVATLDLELLMDSFLDRFIAHFDADRGFILLRKRGSDDFVPAAVRTDRAAVAVSKSIMQKAIDAKAPILVRNALEDVSFVGAKSVIEHQLRSVMLVPLQHGDKVIGLLQLDKDEKDAYSQKSLAELFLLAGSASLAIANARKYEREKQRVEVEYKSRGKVEFVGEHPRIKELLAMARKAATSDARVLITGESGTGKELIATLIHRESKRSSGPWVPINCGALPDNLIESELFGHEKGAFTGATKRKRGAFELADSGTLFLDEIAELPQRMQAKLLRAIQESCFYRLGAERPTHVDIRIVAATNQNLEQLVATGAFREDLYYRLNVVTLKIPALRERASDIEILASHFARRIGEKTGAHPSISSAAMNRLTAYRWPGNVRELKNIIERVMVLGDGKKVVAQNLPLELNVGPSDSSNKSMGFHEAGLHEVLAATERELIARALSETRGNKSAACRMLGISRPTMDKKIGDYNIEF